MKDFPHGFFSLFLYYILDNFIQITEVTNAHGL